MDLAPATTECRPVAGGCDLAEFCTGTNIICPNDLAFPSGTVCRASSDVCDVEETCAGFVVECPTDVFGPDTDGDGMG